MLTDADVKEQFGLNAFKAIREANNSVEEFCRVIDVNGK